MHKKLCRHSSLRKRHPIFTFYIFYISEIAAKNRSPLLSELRPTNAAIYANETLWKLKWFVSDFVYIVVQSED